MQIIKPFKYTNAEFDLVNACRQNDRIAQRTLYESYKNAMYTIALRIVGNPDEASDALQEAFIDVFEEINSFRLESTVGAWIKTIVIRKALRRLKGMKITEPLEKAEKLESDDWHGSIDAAYLEKAIQSLPEGTKAIFLLVEVEGYKHKEVATMLGISEGTSKSQLNYAKKLLQKILYEYYKL
jgi:RNA polymerase sigma-70 factor (ECF subfamily)